jgi:hypothetical protein
MTWTAINPNQLIPSNVVTAITAMGDVLAGALSIDNPLSSLPSLPSISITNPLGAVINAILDTLTGILKAGRIHTLAIPIVKTIPNQPPPSLPPTLGDLQAGLNAALGPPTTAAADAYTKMIVRTGGNAGFYKAFATATNNPQDPNRPQYDNKKDAVVMAVLLVGAPRFSSIASAARTLDILIRPSGDNSFIARTVPIPQNLIAKVVGSSTAPGIGIRLDWDAPSPVNTLRYFPGLSIVVNRYAVIRTTDAKAAQARTVLDLFDTATLTEGLTSGKNKVVKIGSGKNTAYLDTDASIDKATPVYYFIAWECSVQEHGETVTLPFDRLSNVSKVAVKAPTPPQTGSSPNWKATDAAIDALPALSDAAQRFLAEASVMLKPSAHSASRIGDAVKLAQGAAIRLAARSTELVNDIKRLSAAMSAPIPSLYVTQMSSEKGGTAFLLSELAKRLGDTTDGTRPPFDNGEYVCGVCFVAGAPRLADLAKVITFFNAIFGAATASNPLLGLLASIDTLVTQAETVVFQPNMTPFPSGTDLTGVDPATGKPVVAATPAIASDGTPVATLDAANPNAGDTNVTPTSELC